MNEMAANSLGGPTVKLEGVTRTFKQGAREILVLQGVDAELWPGQAVALVGPSGAGKTTFIRLLLRLFNVEQGSIFVDGQNIREATLESLHKNISMVPQDPVLFHRSLLENIRFGRSDATDEIGRASCRERV